MCGMILMVGLNFDETEDGQSDTRGSEGKVRVQ